MEIQSICLHRHIKNRISISNTHNKIETRSWYVPLNWIFNDCILKQFFLVRFKRRQIALSAVVVVFRNFRHFFALSLVHSFEKENERNNDAWRKERKQWEWKVLKCHCSYNISTIQYNTMKMALMPNYKVNIVLSCLNQWWFVQCFRFHSASCSLRTFSQRCVAGHWEHNLKIKLNCRKMLLCTIVI